MSRSNKTRRHQNKSRKATATKRNLIAIAAAIGAMGFRHHHDRLHAATFTWQNTTGSWSGTTTQNNTNWGQSTAPTSSSTTQLNFNGSGSTAYTSTDNITNFNLDKITLNSTATVAETITLSDNLIFVGSDNEITQSGSGAFNINAGSSDSLGAGSTTNSTLFLDGNGTGAVTINASIDDQNSDASNVTKNGTSTFILTNGNNAWSGTTIVNAGILELTADGTLGHGAITINNGGTLEYAGFVSSNITGVTSTYSLTLKSGATFLGTGTAGINQLLTLDTTANSTYTLGTGTSASDTLTIGASDISAGVASGVITVNGSGTVVLAGTESYTGLWKLTSGALSIGADLDLGPVPSSTIANYLTLNGGTLKTTATFPLSTKRGIQLGSSGGTFDQASSTTLTIAGLIDNVSGQSGALTKTDSGTLILSDANTYSGGTTISAGTLVAGAISALGTGNLTLNGGKLDLATNSSINAYNTIVGGAATVTSDLASTGAGITHTLGTLNIGANTLSLTKGTNVTSGTAGLTFGATTLSANGAAFDTASGTNLTLGALSGNFSFTAQDAGQLTLNTASTRTGGAVTLSGGTMVLGNTGALGTTGVGLNLTGGTLDLATNSTVNAYNTTIAGTPVKIASDLASSGAGITHTLGTLAIGADTLDLTKGANVTSGTAILTFGSTTLSANGAVFDSASGTNLTLGALSGNFSFTKQDSGQLTLNSTSVRTSGTVTESGGTMVLGSTSALGTAGVGLNLTGGTLDLATNTSVNAYNTTIAGTPVTIASDLSSSGAGITHTLGTLSIGADQLNLTQGANVTGGTAGLTFGNTTLTGNATFDTAASTNLALGATSGSGFGITKKDTGTMNMTGASSYTGATSVNAGTFALGTGASLGNTAITVSSNAHFAPIASTSAGSTTAGTAGATLNLNNGSFLDLNDGTIGNFTLNQQASWSTTALTLGGTTLNFDLGASSADSILVNKGKASVSGTQIIDIDPLAGLTGLTIGSYTLINLQGQTSATGGLGGTFDFSNNSTTEGLTVNGHNYTLTLTNSGNTEVLGVANAVTATSTTYSLSSVAQNTNLRAGGSTNVTTSITNTGSGTQDTLDYSSLGSASNPSSGVNIGAASAPSGGPLALGASNSTADTQSFTFSNAGSYAINPGATTTNHTLGGSATSSGSTSATVKVWREATDSVSKTNFALGNFHVGDTIPTQTLTIQNTAAADGFSENLDASFGSGTGGVTGTGSINLLGAQGSSTNMSVNASTANAGAINGSVGITFSSDGTGGGNSGFGPTTVDTKNITVTGGVYNYAAPSVATTVNLGAVRAGQSFGTQALNIGNSAPANGFSESLDASFGAATTGGATTNSGSINQLAAGGNNNGSMVVGLGTSTGGLQTGTVAVNFTSDGQGSSGLGTTSLGSQSVTVQGVGYRQAVMQAPTNINFGNVFTGANLSQTLSITNNTPNDGYSEKLDVSFGGNVGNITNNGGSISLLAPGSTSTAMSIGLDASSSGTKSGTAWLSPDSNTSGVAGDTLGNSNLNGQFLSTEATVFDHASIVANTVNLGHITQGDSASFTSQYANATGGFRDAANVTGISPSAAGYSANLGATGQVTTGQAVAINGSFTPTFGSTNGHTFNITYGDWDTGYTGANVNNQTATLQINAIVDPILTISDASDATAAGRSMLSGTPSAGSEYIGSMNVNTIYVVRDGPNHYVPGVMTGVDSNKGYYNIDVVDPQGNPSTFTENPVVALFNFGVSSSPSDPGFQGLQALEADLTAFHYTWFDFLGDNGTNGIQGATPNEGQLAYIPGYQLEVDLPMGGDPVLSFDFSKYDNGNLDVQSLAVVPEPTSVSLMGLGAVGLLARRRRKAKAE